MVWSPGLSFGPHNHRMWVAVGTYGGRELSAGDVALLGDGAIHAVVNPLSAFTGALHVYGGNLPARSDRSEWDLATQTESSFDFSRVTRTFEEANARPGASPGQSPVGGRSSG